MKQTSTYLELEAAISLLEDPKAVKDFLIDLCTPAELRALSERWHVASKLKQAYRQRPLAVSHASYVMSRMADIALS